MEIHMQIKVMVGEDRFLYQPQKQTSGLLPKGRSFTLHKSFWGVTEVLKCQEKSASENSTRMDIP